MIYASKDIVIADKGFIRLWLDGGLRKPQYVLAGWNFWGVSAVVPDGRPADVVDERLEDTALSRGTGLTAVSLQNAFNSSAWGVSTLSQAKADSKYVEFTIKPKSGELVSLHVISFNFRISNSGPKKISLQYSLDGNNFIPITEPIEIDINDNLGKTYSVRGISEIAELQEVASTITLRFYGYEASSGAGTGAFGRIEKGYDIYAIGSF